MNFTGTNSLSSKGLKLYRLCADYRPRTDIKLTYVVTGIGMRDARRKWIESFPWLKILDIREATEEETKEFETTVPEQIQSNIAVWQPQSEGGKIYWDENLYGERGKPSDD